MDHRVLAKQKRRIQSTTTTATESGQRQSIFNVELTLKRDPQHLRTARGRLARQQKECAQETTQLCGFVKSLGGKDENKIAK
jgi:hypothetical protein